MKLFTAIYDDARLLQPFLRHYNRFGITDFFIATSPDFVVAVRDFMTDYRITLFEDLDVSDSFLGGTVAVTQMQNISR
jgi:hypothetical protein